MSKNKAKNIILLFFILVNIILVYVYGKISLFSSLSNDDFIHYNQAIQMTNGIVGNDFITALKYAFFDITHFGGRYFSMFIQYLFGPKPYIDFILQERIMMLINVLLYFLSLLFLSISLTTNLFLKRSTFSDKLLFSYVLFYALIVPINVYNYYHDIFTWYSGAASYTFPISLFSFSFGIMLFVANSKNVVLKSLYVFLAFLSMGGNIGVALLLFMMIIIYCLYLIFSKKFSKDTFYLLLPYLIGFAINILSPGNYFRARQNNDRTFRISTLIIRTIKYVINRFEVVFVKPHFVLVLILFSAIIFILILKYKINIKKYVYCQIIYLVIPFMIASVVALAYNNSLIAQTHLFKEYDCHDRTAYLIDIGLIVLIYHIFVDIMFGIYIFMKNRVNYKALKNKTLPIVICFLICISQVCSVMSKQSIYRIHIMQLIDNLYHNKYQIYYEKYLECIKTLNAEAGKADYIKLEMPVNDIPLYTPFDKLGLDLFFKIENIEFE